MTSKVDKRDLLYDEEAVKFAIALYEKGKVPLEILYELIRMGRITAFSIVVVQAEIENLNRFIHNQKRKTDLLIEIDLQEKVCVLFCQETKVDGGYYFVKRLTPMLRERGAKSVKAAILGIENTNFPLQDLIFIITDTYLKVRNSKNSIETLYRTLA